MTEVVNFDTCVPRDMESNLMTVAQVASILGYSVQHTRLLIRRRKLHALKLGRDWAISRDDLTQYMDSHQHNQISIKSGRKKPNRSLD